MRQASVVPRSSRIALRNHGRCRDPLRTETAAQKPYGASSPWSTTPPFARQKSAVRIRSPPHAARLVTRGVGRLFPEQWGALSRWRARGRPGRRPRRGLQPVARRPGPCCAGEGRSRLVRLGGGARLGAIRPALHPGVRRSAVSDALCQIGHWMFPGSSPGPGQAASLSSSTRGNIPQYSLA